MSTYLIRAGRASEKDKSREDYNLKNNVASIGWGSVDDLSGVNSYKEMKEKVAPVFVGTEKEKAIQNFSSQLWTFKGKIQVGDYIVMPMIAKSGQVAIGKVTSGYLYQPADNYNRHVIGVDWQKIIKRTVFGQDIINGPLVSRGTICSFHKIEEADFRIKKIIENGKDPFFDTVIPDPIEDDGTDGDEFAYETALREYISNHLEIVESDLNLYEDENGNLGVEYPANKWNIDILAVDSKGNLIVIELKKSRCADKVFGQLARYMGWVKEKIAKHGQTVRGIIIGGTISDELKYASSLIDSVQLMEYNMSVKLNLIK